MTLVLETHELRKHFNEVHAVDGVSLQIERGEIFGFLGPNGAGKTTTISMILGLTYPTDGEIRLFGERVTPRKVGPLRRVGALVGAAPALTPYLTARENLGTVARFHKDCDEARVEAVLVRMGLDGFADRKAGTFSTGMKQRLGLAMALLHQPDLLILDEPTNGMDPAGMREVRTLLHALAEDGTTIFLSSHLLHEVEQTCNRVAVLNEGRVVAQGPVEALLGQGAVVRIRVARPRRAADHLTRLPGVTSVDLDGPYVRVAGRESEDVVAHLTQHGIIPAEITASQSNLEDLFLQLTGETAVEQPQGA